MFLYSRDTSLIAGIQGAGIIRWDDYSYTDKTALNVFYPYGLKAVKGSRQMRGGMHMCFPIFGPHPTGALPRHGFMRDKIFRVPMPSEVSIPPYSEMHHVIMHHNQPKGNYFPWEFELDVEIRLDGENWRYVIFIEASKENESPMPYVFGLHPYIATPNHKVRVINGRNIHELDLTSVDDFKPIMMNVDSFGVDIQMPGHGNVSMNLHDGFNKRSKILLWTDSADYLCVEPISSEPSAFETPEGVYLEPGDSRILQVDFGFYRD